MHDGFTAHTGNNHRINVLRADALQPIATEKTHIIFHTILPRSTPGVLQGRPADVGSDGGSDPALLQQVYRQVTVIRSNIGQLGALWHQIGQKVQPGLQMKFLHHSSLPPDIEKRIRL